MLPPTVGFADDDRGLLTPLLMRLRSVGFCESLRFVGAPAPEPLALRPRLPSISCASASFFLRSRASLTKSTKDVFSAIVDGLDTMIEAVEWPVVVVEVEDAEWRRDGFACLAGKRVWNKHGRYIGAKLMEQPSAEL
jgi:hypothetical protein